MNANRYFSTMRTPAFSLVLSISMMNVSSNVVADDMEMPVYTDGEVLYAEKLNNNNEVIKEAILGNSTLMTDLQNQLRAETEKTLQLTAAMNNMAWFEDNDGDGFGDPNTKAEEPITDFSGYVSNGLDCNDGDSLINPSAKEDNTALTDLNCNGESTESPYKIGDYGPAGGFIFHIENAGRNGLEAAPADLNNGVGVQWGCYGEALNVSTQVLGSGARNTLEILDKCWETNTAATQVHDYVSASGYSDWYLPSNDELVAMYTELYSQGIGNFSNAWYWSSSEVTVPQDSSPDSAYGVLFTIDATNTYIGKGLEKSVRPARSF